MAEATDFGKLVLRLREERGWSQPELARRAGCSNGYIGGIEAGIRGKRPGRDFVIRLARAFGVNPYELLEAAGRVQAGDDPTAKPTRPSFEAFVAGEPLSEDERAMLIRLYRSYAGQSRRTPRMPPSSR